MRSMTAFARTMVSSEWGNATWELRSVNHRFFEPSFRLPEALRHLEPNLRVLLKEHLERGRLECTLRYEPCLAQTMTYSRAHVEALLKTVMSFPKDYPMAPLDPLKVLAWPGVLVVDTPLAEPPLELLSSFAQCVEQLCAVRQREGDSIGLALQRHIQDCFKHLEHLKTQVPIVMEGVQVNIKKKLANLISDGYSSSDRLEQEMVFWAGRMDVAEEIQRLEEHLKEVERQLSLTTPVGRRLDFLMQELHREANTLGSKLQDSRITGAVVELKVHIEQMREQIQNLE